MVLEDAGIRADGPPAAVGDCLIGPGSIMDGTPYATTRDTGIERLPAELAGLLAASPPAEPRPRAGLADGPGVGLRSLRDDMWAAPHGPTASKQRLAEFGSDK